MSINTVYNLKNSKVCKRKGDFEKFSETPFKRSRNISNLVSLPKEILLYIFSYLSIEDLFFSVRSVCQRFYQTAKFAASWQDVIAENKLSTSNLVGMFKFSPIIKNISISNRNDADQILCAISKNLKNVESLTVKNCWGSKTNSYLGSTVLCRLLMRCKRLTNIRLECVKIRSIKFFKLLADRKRYENISEMCYIGPATAKQYSALKECCAGCIFTEYLVS